MSDNNPSSPPEEQTEKKRQHKAITFPMYEAMFNFYKDADRTPKTLANQFNISLRMAKEVITKGDEENGWPPLKDRAKFYDNARIMADANQSAIDAQERLQSWEKTKQENLKISLAGKAAVSNLLRRAIEALPTIKFVKYRTFIDHSGKTPVAQTVEVPMNGNEMAEGLRKMAMAIRDLAAIDAFWLGGKPGEGELPETAQQLGSITMEQLNYISKTGQLPPGVTESMLFNFTGQNGGQNN